MLRVSLSKGQKIIINNLKYYKLNYGKRDVELWETKKLIE